MTRKEVQKPKQVKETLGYRGKLPESTARRTGKSVDLAYPAAPKQEWREPNSFDLSELYSSRAVYTAQEKLSAVTAFVMTGTVSGASRLTGFRKQLISDWKNKATWWPDAYKAVKVQKQEEMDGVMTSIIHIAAEEVVDRLLNGDEVITKDGDIRQKKLNGKDVAWILAIVHDKRALLRGDPTSRTEKVDTAKLLEQMKAQFEEMGKAKVVSDQ